MNLFGCFVPCSLKHSCWFSNESYNRNARNSSNLDYTANSSITNLLLNSYRTMGVNASSVTAHNSSIPSCSDSNNHYFQSSNNEMYGVVFRERKKKATGFATLRKKFIRRRRSSKVCDHGRMLRELVSDWSPLEVAALLEEYEALVALKDLSVQAELARPPATTFKQDLSALYDYKYCTDADLIFRGACFPIHRALLSARCPYFRDLLAGCPGYGARICLELNRTAHIDVNLFSALLRYLYTGDICTHDTNIDLELLRRLREEFGTPNPLEHDLRYLLETGDYADAALVFTSDATDYQRNDSCSSEYGFRPKLELPCHKAILSARSPFFRNLIQRRSRSGEEHTERALHIPSRIILDESVIPKRFARVLLHAIYLDTVDLSLILRNDLQNGSLSLGEAHVLANGPSSSRNLAPNCRPSLLDEAMELYQIGRFLELDILVQGCEDIILEWLSINTLPTVLRWSSQPHGSGWVYRQAMHFLREEFHLIAQSSILFQINKEHLLKALESNFLQASELEILQAVLKWGEHELTKRMEDREPNILNHTAHSVSRKGVKKRDLNDVELREILADFFPLIRLDHILPQNCELLQQAIKRGLVSTPPSHMIGDDSITGGSSSVINRRGINNDGFRHGINAWIRMSGCRRNTINGLYIRPRFFMPYYEELKLLVEDQMVQDVQRLRRMHCYNMPNHVPDTLYMVEDNPLLVSNLNSTATNNIDAVIGSIPLPDPITMCAMMKRLNKLKQSPICLRATESPLSNRAEINKQIRLRVVREFNLPDSIADILDSSYFRGTSDHDLTSIPNKSEEDFQARDQKNLPLLESSNNQNVNQNRNNQILASNQNLHCSKNYGQNSTFPRFSSNQATNRDFDLPAIVTEGFNHFESSPSSFQCRRHASNEANDLNSCSEGHLSEVMPDVAMATANFSQLQIHGDQQELELDLGDGTSHLHAGAALISQPNLLATSSMANPFVIDSNVRVNSPNLVNSAHSSNYRFLNGNTITNPINYYNRQNSNSSLSSELNQMKPSSTSSNFYTGPRFL